MAFYLSKNLFPSLDFASLQGNSYHYKEITEYLDLSKGKSEEESQVLLDNAIDTIKKNTRHYVKRQLTWFRRERDVIWIDKDEYKDDEQILEYMIEHLKTNGAIK